MILDPVIMLHLSHEEGYVNEKPDNKSFYKVHI